MFRLASIVFLIFAASQAAAQEDQAFITNIGVPCDTKEEMSKVITKKYGETPFVMAMGHMTLLNSKTVLPGVVKIWANPQTWTYSITLESPEADIMCMLTSGQDFQPISAGNPT